MSNHSFQHRIPLAVRLLLPVALGVCLVGCASSVKVRYVPRIGAVRATTPNLKGSQPVELKAGECSATETNIGTIGTGHLVGNMKDWTDAALRVVSKNLEARGATLTPGASKVLSIATTSAEVHGKKMGGGSTCRVVLVATTSDGLKRTFEGFDSASEPLVALDVSMANAITNMLSDAAIDEYLRR